MASSPISVSEVYILDFDANRFASLLSVEESDDMELLMDRFHGVPIRDQWEPIRMYWETNAGTRPLSDFSTIIGGGVVFNARALEALGDLLEGRGEMLPLEVEAPDAYHVFNVTRLSEALDEERSEFVYFSDGRIMVTADDRYEFDVAELASETIFKLPQIPEVYEYVTDAFRQRVEEAGLTGFLWDRHVWCATEAAHSPQSGAERG